MARTAVGCASLDGTIYAVGGECALASAHDDTQYLTHVESYDPEIEQWFTCSPMNVARSFVSVCELDGYLYAVGRYGSRARGKSYCYSKEIFLAIN